MQVFSFVCVLYVHVHVYLCYVFVCMWGPEVNLGIFLCN